jgi:hypothetical protein
MKKALFLGPADKREQVIGHLQKLGVVQVEPYTGDDLPRDNVAID